MPYNSYSDDDEYEISNIKRSEAGGFFRGHHTDKQLQEALQAEREECITACLNGNNRGVNDCIEAIRKRGE